MAERATAANGGGATRTRRAAKPRHYEHDLARDLRAYSSPLRTGESLLSREADEIESNIRRNIRIVLHLRGIPATELYTALGLTRAAFSNKMTGKTRFTIPEFVRMCEVLDISPQQVIMAVISDPYQKWKFLRAGATNPQATATIGLSRGNCISEGRLARF